MEKKVLVDIETIMSKVMAEAHNARESAGYSGSWGDGGAGVMEAQVQFYRYGRDGVVPPEWQKYAEQARKEADPEYSEYQRLKGKFER
jgi:hypothetical protein